jgi:hypothetical protein
MYAYRDEKGWEILSVDSGNSVGIGNSLVLDMLEQPCISYHGNYDKYMPMKYAYWDYGDWQIKTIEFVSSPGENTSLMLDGDGSPHITYKANNDLMYAYRVEPYSKTSLWPIENWGYGLPGSTITYTLQVLNTTQLTDTFDVAASGHDWPTITPSVVGPLAPAESAALGISASVPATVALGSEDTVTITVTLQGDSSKTGSAKLTTFAGHVFFMPVIEK